MKKTSYFHFLNNLILKPDVYTAQNLLNDVYWKLDMSTLSD